MKRIIIRFFGGIGFFIFVIIMNLVIFNMSASKISMGVPISEPVSENSALLVVDIQEGTTGDESLTSSYKEQSPMLIDSINFIIDKANEKDWPIIYIKNEVSNPMIKFLNGSLAEGSPGAELDKRLKISSDYILAKNKKDAFSNPELDRILIEEKIGNLVFVGLDAAYCVNSTILAAKNRGYAISVIENAVISESDSLKLVMFDDFREIGVHIISSN